MAANRPFPLTSKYVWICDVTSWVPQKASWDKFSTAKYGNISYVQMVAVFGKPELPRHRSRVSASAYSTVLVQTPCYLPLCLNGKVYYVRSFTIRVHYPQYILVGCGLTQAMVKHLPSTWLAVPLSTVASSSVSGDAVLAQFTHTTHITHTGFIHEEKVIWYQLELGK